MKKIFKSDVGREFIKMARDQLGVQVITPVYFGSRNVNLKPDRQIRTPADMAGIKLRMPPGEFWQFLGESIGANPVPVAYAEVYTALQTGAIDGQDNPLVASKLMKFYEVTTQFVLTGHVIGYDVMTISTKIWDAMTPAQQTAFQAAADKAIDDYVVKFSAKEKEVLDFFKAEGKKVYTPDVQRVPDICAEKIPRQVRPGLAEGRVGTDQRNRVSPAYRRVMPAIARNGWRIDGPPLMPAPQFAVDRR